MAETKIVVIYPRPTDLEAFEKVYVEEHVPLAVEKIKGPTKFAATKVVGTPDGSTPPFYRIAEFYFPSMQALQDCAASAGVSDCVKVAIPQPEGWGAFTSAYWKRGGGLLQSPNRKVGDISFQPTAWELNEASRMDRAALSRLA